MMRACASVHLLVHLPAYLAGWLAGCLLVFLSQSQPSGQWHASNYCEDILLKFIAEKFAEFVAVSQLLQHVCL
jgi:hypothetical protein